MKPGLHQHRRFFDLYSQEVAFYLDRYRREGSDLALVIAVGYARKLWRRALRLTAAEREQLLVAR